MKKHTKNMKMRPGPIWESPRAHQDSGGPWAQYPHVAVGQRACLDAFKGSYLDCTLPCTPPLALLLALLLFCTPLRIPPVALLLSIFSNYFPAQFV